MTREDTLEGLELCLKGLCDICPYKDSDAPGGCKDELMYDAMILLQAQEPPTDVSISSAIECLLHPQDADGSDMAKAIDTAVRTMRLLKEQEPVEPTRKPEIFDSVYFCGKCSAKVGFQIRKDDSWRFKCKFCPNCGQAVKWE